MAEESSAVVTWKGKLELEARAAYDQAIRIDAAPPQGDDHGIKPMELFLISLASCAGQIVVSLLQKMRQDVRAFTVKAHGLKQAEHPRVFTSIRLDMEITGANIDRASAEKALQLAEEKYCPVFAMLKNSVPVQSVLHLIDVS